MDLSSFSSEDIEYEPQLNDKDLVCNDFAYKYLDYLDVEWPSQSICVMNARLFFSSFNETNIEKNIGNIYSISLDDFISRSLKNIRTIPIQFYINRFRSINEQVFFISDNILGKINEKYQFTYITVSFDLSFGFYLCDQYIYIGTKDGALCIYDHDLNFISQYKIHLNSIETITIFNNVIYTASADKTIKKTIINNDNFLSEIIYEGIAEINSIDIQNNILIFGDDNGMIGIINNDNLYKICNWHKSSIEMVHIKNDDELVFGACSQEQVTVWDLTLENNSNIIIDSSLSLKIVQNEIEINKKDFLLFVHQGQQFYKDIVFYNNKTITTSINGICLFQPISFD